MSCLLLFIKKKKKKNDIFEKYHIFIGVMPMLSIVNFFLLPTTVRIILSIQLNHLGTKTRKNIINTEYWSSMRAVITPDDDACTSSPAGYVERERERDRQMCDKQTSPAFDYADS